MGFMNEEITVVGSSAYNLAGEPKNRGKYLKNVIIGSTLSGRSSGLGMDIYNSHISGPGLKFKRFSKWAKESGYTDSVGMPDGYVVQNFQVTLASLNQIKPAPPATERMIVSNSFEGVVYQYLGEEWLGDNRPEYLGTDFVVEAETTRAGLRTRLTGKLIIKGAGYSFTFTPSVDILTQSTIVYAKYKQRALVPTINTDLGDQTTYVESDLPDLTDFTGSYSPVVTEPVILNTVTEVVKVFSDARPEETTTSTTSTGATGSKKSGIFTKTGVHTIGTTSTDRTTTHEIVYDWEIQQEVSTSTVVEEMEPGVTAEITTTVTVDSLVPVYRYHTLYADAPVMPWGPMLTASYAMGTDPVIDAALEEGYGAEVGRYLPIIPLRVQNREVNATNYPEQYARNVQAAKKAFGDKKTLTKLMEGLLDNDDIDEIDHAWIVFGVSLGTEQEMGTEYLYSFFKALADSTPYRPGQIRDPQAYAAAVSTYWDQLAAYQYPDTEGGGSRPPQPTRPTTVNFNFKTYTNRGLFGNIIVESTWRYNINITAKGGNKIEGTGMHSRAKGKVGTTWKYHSGIVSIKNYRTENNGDSSNQIAYYEVADIIRFGKQLTQDTWEEYEFFDLAHINNVYGGLSVDTLGLKGLNGGENSGFLVPLNDVIFESLPLIPRTQLALECSYMVVNYYDKQKVPWYATGFFKVIVIVVVIVVSVVFPPAGAAGGAGILGSNAAVGVALGAAAGTAAAVLVGAIANALAAMIVTAVISKVSTTLLGDKIGNIVGSVVSMIVVWAGSNGWNFDSIDSTTLFQEFTKADNLLKLTMNGAKTVGDYLGAQAQELINDSQELLADYRSRSEELAAMTQQYLGGTDLDPRLISEATRYLVESPEQFLGRTLMTGDDIVETSISLIEDFPRPQLRLPNFEG